MPTMTEPLRYDYLSLMGTVQSLDDRLISDDETVKFTRDFYALMAMHKLRLSGHVRGVAASREGRMRQSVDIEV